MHWSDPTWYAYVDPGSIDEHGWIMPEGIRELVAMADQMHARAEVPVDR
jgi:hypothetical protein